MPQGKKIFISYRRGDSADFTVALYNRLKLLFGEECIFKDINSIPIGLEFAEVLNDALNESAVVLVIMGNDYFSEYGHRLFNEDDWVRQEVVMALEMGLRVVPVLINGAAIPTLDLMPESMQPLMARQIARISNPSFDEDVNRIAEGLSDTIPLKPEEPTVPGKPNGSIWDNMIKAVLLLVMLVSIGLIAFAWALAEVEFREKVFMSLLGLAGVVGGWAGFTRQRWLELRSLQIN